MAQDITNLTGLDYFEGKPLHSDTEALSQGDKGYEDILELNQFDGLPYSSRFYKLLRERKKLPVWKAKSDFMDTLAKEQIVNVSGCAKTGRSSQVSTVRHLPLLIALPWKILHISFKQQQTELSHRQIIKSVICAVSSLFHSYFEPDSPVVC